MGDESNGERTPRFFPTPNLRGCRSLAPRPRIARLGAFKNLVGVDVQLKRKNLLFSSSLNALYCTVLSILRIEPSCWDPPSLHYENRK